MTKKHPSKSLEFVRIFCCISSVKVQTNHQKSDKTTITFTKKDISVSFCHLKILKVQIFSRTATESFQKVEIWICDTFFHHQHIHMHIYIYISKLSTPKKQNYLQHICTASTEVRWSWNLRVRSQGELNKTHEHKAIYRAFWLKTSSLKMTCFPLNLTPGTWKS